MKRYAELTALSQADLQQMTLGLGGSALCLDARDLHVSTAAARDDDSAAKRFASTCRSIDVCERGRAQHAASWNQLVDAAVQVWAGGSCPLSLADYAARRTMPIERIFPQIHRGFSTMSSA